MKISRKVRRSAVSLLLALFMLVSLVASQPGAASAADEQEKELLGTLSKKYEASSPGTISSGVGDAGGKSYGSYQFSSASDIPKKFFEWCQASDDTYYRSIGDRLSDAYYDDSPGYNASFDSMWKILASENAAGFEQVQRNYVRLSYYDPIIRRIEKDFPGFDIDNYSIALRNVLWSRAVQLGVGGAASMMDYAVNILGGFANQPEAEVIRAIYADSAEVRAPKNNKEETMSGTTAKKYGVDGKVLSWFCGSSGDVQLGVYIRLAINEPAQAQKMLATYGYVDAPLDEGLYLFSPSENDKLAMVAAGTTPTVNTLSDDAQNQMRLTYYASGYYTITDSNGQRLAANSDGSLSFETPSTSNSQMWKLENSDSGFSVKNRSTEQYLTVSDPSAGSKVSSAAQPYQWQLTKGGATWSLVGASYPSYSSTLLEGNSSFSLVGTLRCSYPIQTVTARVLTASGKDAFTPVSASDVGAKYYDLSKMDSKMVFSKLSAGAYTMVITATSSAPTNNTFRMESPFFVSDGNYMVRFDACGGTVDTDVLKVVAGQAYGELPEAVKPGHFFRGWYTAAEGGTKVSASDIATASNIVLYAQYEKAFTYQFLNHDGSVFASGALMSGETIPLPADKPLRPADQEYYYTFAGWDGYTEGMTISGDITFTARFDSHLNEVLPNVTSDAYSIKDGILRAIPIGTALEDFQKNLIPSEYITIHANSGKLVGTGMTVEYTVGDQQIQTLTVVVTGDTSGDGKCTVTDMVQLQSHLLGKKALTDAAVAAADLNGDGKCTITDMVQLTSALLGRSNITPH